MLMTQIESTNTGAAERKLKILLIDDDKLLTDMIAESLVYHGYEVVTFNVSQSAVRLYETEFKHFDVIILDMMMPNGGGGKDCFAALRRINPEAKVLLSSGYCISDEVEAMLKAGAIGFLEKPFKLAELARKVDLIKAEMQRSEQRDRAIIR